MLIHCGSILVIEGKKLGSLLLEEVENDAKSKGAKLIHLDTFDFQAKEFYEKQGILYLYIRKLSRKAL